MNRLESNPILGSHPGPLKVLAYFLVCGAAHAALSALLPQGGLREAWQGIWTVAEGWQVGANAQSGISIP